MQFIVFDSSVNNKLFILKKNTIILCNEIRDEFDLFK